MMGFVRAPLFFMFFSAFLFHGLCVRRTKIDVFRHAGEASGGADEANAPANAPGPSTPPSGGVQVQVQDKYVVVDNGILQVNLSNPGGSVTGIQYNGINLLEEQNDEFNRGYWDVVWNAQESNKTKGKLDRLDGTKFEVIVQNDEQVELSFARMWNLSLEGEVVPLNIDKRYVILRGSSGFYTYAIYEHLAEWPAFTIDNTRTVIKLRKDKFHYMAIADNRQRYMPLPDDRLPGRGQVLAYPEAVRLINPVEPQFKGEVDDKYEYSCESKDIGVHGWISTDPPIGVWQITPSHEFRNGGPVKQFLTSHVGPTSLNVFASTHYSGINLTMRFGTNEPWKKVYGPVFVYVNSMSDGEDPRSLWMDAKEQLIAEAESWPYKFPASEDYVQPSQRGNVSGRLLVLDRYISEESLVANGAFVGLAPPGDIGSWQRESKGYQFWTRADEGGNFSITGIIPGEYNLYAWVPGFIGDYKYEKNITISAASDIDVGELVYEPPRSGPTLWEIGIPDRTASEYYVPDPDPQYINPLYINHPDRYRQYGLWQRYAELYPNEDLIFSVGMSDYRKDWFFAQVTREIGNNTYKGTTWQIKFTIYSIDHTGTYKLQLALATAHESELQVRVNDGNASSPLFSTGVIGKDNTIARHGIHGLYWLFSIDVPGTELIKGENTIFFTQIGSVSPFQGIMYDYIRLETPPPSNSTYRF